MRLAQAGRTAVVLASMLAGLTDARSSIDDGKIVTSRYDSTDPGSAHTWKFRGSG